MKLLILITFLSILTHPLSAIDYSEGGQDWDGVCSTVYNVITFLGDKVKSSEFASLVQSNTEQITRV